MYNCICGEQLFPEGWIAKCSVCGRGYMKTSNGNLVQVSRPTPAAPDGGTHSAKSGSSRRKKSTNKAASSQPPQVS